jgi:catechol 2,3-dioxygenase-like lactoylglutathione lyase family enzyme
MERNLENPGKTEPNRRQVLQALGLIATGAFAASAIPKAAAVFAARAAQGAASGGKAFPVSTVNHLALSAAAYAKSRDFYVDLFGMRVAWDDGKQCALEFGSLTSPNGMYIRPLRPGEKPTVGHIAFGIPNFMSQKAAMKAEMERRGVKNIRPDGERGWSCDDPAGYLLNIWVPEKDKAMFPGAAGPCEVATSEKCLTAWQAGQKNLNAAPKANGKSFHATSYSFIVLNVPDVAEERDFYRDLLGMKVVYDKLEGPRAECFLRFGQNTLQLRKTNNPAAKPYCNQFGLMVENYDRHAVEGELKRRGFNPKPDSRLSWSIIDPDGYHIDVSGAGFSEHLANDCRGNSASCPGGPTG